MVIDYRLVKVMETIFGVLITVSEGLKGVWTVYDYMKYKNI